MNAQCVSVVPTPQVGVWKRERERERWVGEGAAVGMRENSEYLFVSLGRLATCHQPQAAAESATKREYAKCVGVDARQNAHESYSAREFSGKREERRVQNLAPSWVPKFS